jgi:hypothetical protein
MSVALPALSSVARTYADTTLAAVRREYPNHPRHQMNGPDDLATPSELHPAFYGCFDWHSAVEMHWALARLARLVPGDAPVDEITALFDDHLSADKLRREADYLSTHPGFERPYGWGWALALVDELADQSMDDPRAAQWAANLAPLADTVTAGFVRWLPRAGYPDRGGMHGNSAFALARALPYARRRAQDGDGALLAAIDAAARRWFAGDSDYPAAWEPSGADFLSGALTEAVLMGELLEPGAFADWLAAFLPGLRDGAPRAIFEPVTVTDPTDGQGAHLHGLNLYRAHAFDQLARHLPSGAGGADVLREASRRHADASLPAVSGSDWMVEHWLAAYAVLLLG